MLWIVKEWAPLAPGLKWQLFVLALSVGILEAAIFTMVYVFWIIGVLGIAVRGLFMLLGAIVVVPLAAFSLPLQHTVSTMILDWRREADNKVEEFRRVNGRS